MIKITIIKHLKYKKCTFINVDEINLFNMK